MNENAVLNPPNDCEYHNRKVKLINRKQQWKALLEQQRRIVEWLFHNICPMCGDDIEPLKFSVKNIFLKRRYRCKCGYDKTLSNRLFKIYEREGERKN